MKRFTLSLDMWQWALFRSMLEQEGIRFATANEQFASLFPGMGVGAFQRELLVEDADFDRATAFLKEFLENL